MRTLKRNETAFYYMLYLGTENITDSLGYETGEKSVRYGNAELMFANVSPATGQSTVEQFGSLDRYDKVIVTDDLLCPIDENTVLFIDIPPTYDSNGNPLYDYIVRRVAKSLNSISIAVSKVMTS